MVTIKNIPTIVGTDADVVDLVDEVVLVSPADDLSTHAVTTDDSSVTNFDTISGDLLSDIDTFFDGDVANI